MTTESRARLACDTGAAGLAGAGSGSTPTIALSTQSEPPFTAGAEEVVLCVLLIRRTGWTDRP